MTTTTTNREAEAYLDAVRRALADLPEEERGELLEDLAQHLTDIATDETRADVPLVDLLGSPADYASELRTAAGLPSPSSSRRLPPVPRPDLRAWLNNSSLGKWANGPTGQSLIGPVVSLARDLTPAWWVARAVIAVIGFFVLSSNPPGLGWQQLPVPQVLGTRLLGLVLIVGAVVVSVRLGRRGYGGRRRLVLVADVVIAMVALSLVMEASLRLGASGSGGQVVYVEQGTSADALVSPHGPVTNIYPYDSQGRALDNVLLYDQDGRPLRVARQEWWADGCQRTPTHPLAADGVPVEFSYPVNYTVDLQPFTSFDPETRTYMEQTVTQNCQQQIARPAVPLPTFPPEVTTGVAPEGGAETPSEDAPQTAP